MDNDQCKGSIRNAQGRVEKKIQTPLFDNGSDWRGLFYFVMPLDAIPDFIPFAGFIDDLAVLTAISNAVQDELLAYRLWREKASLGKTSQAQEKKDRNEYFS